MKKVKKMITALATSILVLGCNKYRKITIYKKDIIDLAPNAHEVFMSYII